MVIFSYIVRCTFKIACIQLVLEDELAADDSTDTVDLKIPLSTSTALRLNNNMLSSWDGFGDTMTRLFVEPAAHLCWLDLAFNDIRAIDEVYTYTYLYIPYM